MLPPAMPAAMGISFRRWTRMPEWMPYVSNIRLAALWIRLLLSVGSPGASVVMVMPQPAISSVSWSPRPMLCMTIFTW